MSAAPHEMAPARGATASGAPAARRSFHYKPSLRFHTEEAVRHVDTLAAIVLAWVTEKRPGKVLDEAGEIDRDEMRAQLAHALSTACEWEGAAVAEALASAWRWPVDQPLMNLIHSWSCGLHRAKYEAFIASRELKRARRARHHT